MHYNPHTVAPSITYRDTKDLADTLNRLFPRRVIPWWQLEGTRRLNRKAKSLSRAQLLLAGVGIPHVGFRWKSDDGSTSKWYPQGITGLSRSGRKFVVVSWYSKHSPNKGVRLSFCDVTDMSAVRYRHVLLVQPKRTGTFGPVRIHAGGLAVRGHKIFVADSTDPGIRVFDARCLLPASADADKDRCGVIGGRAYAYDYRYVLPQLGRYDIDDAPRFSFLSTDWSDLGRVRLISGNYHSTHAAKYRNPPPRVAAWLLDRGGNITRYDRGWTTNVSKTQGAAVHDGTMWLSRSGSNASLRVASSPYRRFKTYGIWPHGTEDLYASKSSGNLWCLTEHPGERLVFAVKRSRYRP